MKRLLFYPKDLSKSSFRLVIVCCVLFALHPGTWYRVTAHLNRRLRLRHHGGHRRRPARVHVCRHGRRRARHVAHRQDRHVMCSVIMMPLCDRGDFCWCWHGAMRFVHVCNSGDSVGIGISGIPCFSHLFTDSTDLTAVLARSVEYFTATVYIIQKFKS